MRIATWVHRTAVGSLMLLAVGTAAAQKGETVKIAWIDPLSGLMAPVGQNQVKSFQFFAEKFNKDARLNPTGVRFEIVPFDNKLSPSETLNALKTAVDQGVRYVTQGNGSSVAGAMIDAVAKHNERNPGKEVIYLNHSAVDPDFTNSRCSYWHFRFDADTSMKMEALTSYMKDQPDVKSVYLINQNYSHGQQVSRYFKDTIARKRPDVKVVGDDLHPLGQVKDFAPFVAKIKASGADSVVTGNWGQDLTLLIKAAKDSGLNANFYTYYAGVSGTPTALAAGVGGNVRAVSYIYNSLPGVVQSLQTAFKKKFDDDWYTGATYNGVAMLVAAMAQAKSVDPVKVAAVMGGLRFQGFQGEVEMRKTD
ncbi:MAG: branched-chain amino acid ABC transporter substrate-binding protein, partial [Methylibium sp.]|nr:branched-chain amino acid ABC transporter substrate-binding protein [Methylibium sp.]